jgi:hypothetical protein
MTVRKTWIATAAGLGLLALGCDVSPEGRPGQTKDPMATIGLDEADQMPNLVASVDTGVSMVMFAEPSPGTVVILEKARGASVLRPNATDVEATWREIAHGKEMPRALHEAIARANKGPDSATLAKRAKAQEGREGHLAELADELRRNNADMAAMEARLPAPATLPSTFNEATGCGDPQQFVNMYCSNWQHPANKSEACLLNRVWNGTTDATFGPWNNANYAFAAVCGLSGEFDFVVQHNTFWSWTTDCDLWTTAGVHWAMAIRASYFDFQFRYVLQRVNGDTYHRMNYVDSNPLDPSGFGTYVIPH